MIVPIYVIIVGNYPLDRQKSMEGFARLMHGLLAERGVSSELLVPGVWLGRWLGGQTGVGKWVGYFDKFIIFPFVLVGSWFGARWRCGPRVRVHIADHSNAMYALVLPRSATVVTCHDMLAVRAGLGEEGTACTASFTGRLFQRLIKRGLSAAGVVPCDSTATLNDFLRIVQPRPRAGQLLHIAMNADFILVDAESVARILKSRLPFAIEANYLFHVGSALPRKNRATVVAVFALMRAAGWDGWLVFAGAGEADDVAEVIRKHRVGDRVIFLGDVSHEELNALYSGAFALVFPSLSEGFGWPPVEANASGCPVVASNTTSLPEICGDGAQLYDPLDAEGISCGLLALRNSEVRAEWMVKGFVNARRFSREAMADQYLEVYGVTPK